MNTYYRGQRARAYNRRWHAYTEKTLAAVLAMIDMTLLTRPSTQRKQPPRVLDVACGTGLLLQRLFERVPEMEAYGVDGSADMLAQAQEVLKGQPRVQLDQVDLNQGGLKQLSYAPQTFDLITCTNALHDMVDPVAFLAELRALLVPEGQLVVEDFAPREPRVLWAAFEHLLRRIETTSVHALTLDEAHTSCESAGLCVAAQKRVVIDWFWHGWVLLFPLGMLWNMGVFAYPPGTVHSVSLRHLLHPCREDGVLG